MTKKDRWSKRPEVLRYRAFCDECRLKGVHLPVAGAHIIFICEMPKSWTKKKKLTMVGKPHTQKPDVDNFCKALLDALYKNDSKIWDLRITKVWGYEGQIEIKTKD